VLSQAISSTNAASIEVAKATKLDKKSMHELCEATLETIKHNNGFNIGFSRRYSYDTDSIAQYFTGVLAIPERTLFIAYYNGLIAGSIQMLKQHPSYETMAFACSVDNHFVAPWARGHGIARKLLEAVEEEARYLGFSMMKVSVRSTRSAAIKLYEAYGFIKWGSLDRYEFVDGKYIGGIFYYKDI